MADDVRDKVITLRSMIGAAATHEAAVDKAAAERAKALGGPWQQAAIMARVGNALLAMEHSEEQDGGPNVLTSPQDELASRMQASLADYGRGFTPLGPGGQELKFDTITDPFGWAWSWLSEWDADHHAIVRPASNDPEPIGNNLRIGLVSDWGTGLYGAPAIASNILSKCADFDMLMHLGDVYYAGSAKEMRQRFLDIWPRCPTVINRALNGNHEMYSGGHAYFETTLPAFRQPSSYFAYQNDHWLLAALDTACDDFDLDQTQANWLDSLINRAGSRRVVLFSHHQLYSQLDSQGPKLAQKLGSLLRDKKIHFWYWGHEHRCVLYDVHAGFNLLARCVGNGGMPQRRGKEKDAPIDSQKGDAIWRKLLPKPNVAPAAVILDGRNPFIRGEENTYSPHGYVTLQFSGNKLHESYFLPDGSLAREVDF
ncbi:MAG TPA: metallophosphoesterase [Bryobacteraceae bacterium]|nr:metallophosphoesterase [Bryobacteraceae bacterium]